MSLFPFANPLGASENSRPLLVQNLLPHPNPNPRISFKKNSVSIPGRKIYWIRCTNPRETSEILEEQELSIFRPWDVPWDWKVTVFVMMPYLMSIVLTGVLESGGLAGMQPSFKENMPSEIHTTDELAINMLIDQLLKSIAKLSVLYLFVSQHQPFPNDIFSLSLGKPLNLQKGWVLWAAGGLLIASFAVFLLKAFLPSSYAGDTHSEAESLVRLLPLIGSSNLSTVCLLGVLGILAPICEETLYRGFLLTSLTKWFPMPLSVVLSSAVFTLGHQSPGKSLEIFVFGMVLGLVYARTRNLLTPITLHACWNSGVILLLTYLQSQGQDIQKYML